MLKEIADGVDQHSENAINIFGADPKDPKKFKELRTLAKIVTFRLLYGGTHMGFYYDQQMPNFSKKKWKTICGEFWAKYQVLADWQAKNRSKVWANQGILRNPTGRLFRFFKDPEKGYKPAQIANFPVQSLATADIMILAMVIIYRKYKAMNLKSLIIGQVHDALIFDCTKDDLLPLATMCIDVFNELPNYIEQTFGFNFDVPLTGDADYGECWGEMQGLKLAA